MADIRSFDLETHLIGPGAVYPKPVCATFAERNGGYEPHTALVSNGDECWPKTFEEMLTWLEEDETRQIVAHNGHGFDEPVVAVHFPHLISRIFRALERGQFRDTITREKLLNLALNGVVDYYFTPDGQAKQIRYNLATLAAKYLGVDRTAVKGTDAEGNVLRTDVWRNNFRTLDGVPSDKYPPDASQYALEDARDTLLIYYAQQSVARDKFVLPGAVGHDGQPFDVFRTEPLHVGAMFCLSLASYEGFRVDPAEVAILEAAVAKATQPEQIELLFSSGLFSRPLPPRPYKNGAKNEDGTPKMVAAEPAHRSNKKLLEFVVSTWEKNQFCDEGPTDQNVHGCVNFGKECLQHGLPPLKHTEPSKKFPKTPENPLGGQISCDGEVIADLSTFDPVLGQYERYQGIQKLMTLEIPRLQDALKHGGTIHPSFDEFKKTGRTSSRRSKFFPSVNIQQIPRGIDIEEMGPDCKPLLDDKGKPRVIKVEPRHSYLPSRPGWVLVSIDYSSIELVSLASTLKRVLGYSTMLEKNNAGHDLHSFLGAQLARGLDSHFAEFCRDMRASQLDDIYKLFISLKAGSSDEKKFFKSWRTFAKPVNLGFPGGLGLRTFIIYAKKLYGVVIQGLEQAKQFREIFFMAFPEIREYLNDYVRNELKDDDPVSEKHPFSYWSPLGAYRTRCSFTEGANGFALQTPAAEGMKLALWRVQRACWDPEVKSCLYGCRVNAAIHDEVLISIPNDQWMHERAFEASRLWIEGMNVICPDAVVRAEPAAMHRWDKNGEPVYSKSDKRLRVWEPKGKYETDENGRLWTA